MSSNIYHTQTQTYFLLKFSRGFCKLHRVPYDLKRYKFAEQHRNLRKSYSHTFLLRTGHLCRRASLNATQDAW